MPKKLKQLLTIIIVLTVGLSLFSFFKKTQNHTSIQVDIPIRGISTKNIAILVKQTDVLSQQTADLYQRHREIPKNNIYTVNLPDTDSVEPSEFNRLYRSLKSKLPEHIQAFVITWQKPYRVACMSMTSALTFGFDRKWCQPQKKGCHTTHNSPYFNRVISNPWTDISVRPSMMLTGNNISEIETLIQRGIAADGSRPKAKAVLMKTSDKNRSTRWPIFKNFAQRFPYHPLLDIYYIDAPAENVKDYIENESNLILYETGLTKVPAIETLQFVPGAVADHLTSFGGQGVSNKGQMKAFRWLENGVTGSYGTVVEPCNYPQKFPNPEIFLLSYLQGETLLESYWKSVQQPGEGLFIGEPLARPYDLHNISRLGGHLKILTNRLDPDKNYVLLEWNQAQKDYRIIPSQFIRTGGNTMMITAKSTSSQKFKVRLKENQN